MSKVVKGVGRAIGKVVKGVGNVVKKVASSKFGKILLTAAAVYFGGAALMGGLSSSAAGTGFLSGMSSGLSSAASGIGNAFTALTGGNLSGAGTALAEGFTGGASAATTGASAAAPAAASASPWASTSTGLNVLASEAAPAASKGLVGSFMNSPYTAPALISGGTQLIGGAMQGYGAQQQQKEQLKMAAAERNRYNANVGARLWPNAG